jgi:hypothetical protein
MTAAGRRLPGRGLNRGLVFGAYFTRQIAQNAAIAHFSTPSNWFSFPQLA